MYQLGSLFGSSPLRQINMVGPYVTLYCSSSLEFTFNNHEKCVASDMEPDHDAAHSTNILRTYLDANFRHAHVILPGKHSLAVELKNLLISDQSKYGISELQIDDCIRAYHRHVDNYSPMEHKQTVHNLIRSVIRYHYVRFKEDTIIPHDTIDDSIKPVKKALVQSMIEPKYSQLEALRQTLQVALLSLNPENKNAFVEALTSIIPDTPSRDFNRLMSGNWPGEPGVLGGMLLMVPAFLFVLMAMLLERRTREVDDHLLTYQQEAKTPFYLLMAYIDHRLSAHQNELNISVILYTAIVIFGYWAYNAPEISETIYNQLTHAWYGKKPYVNNKELKKLVDDFPIADLEKSETIGPSVR